MRVTLFLLLLTSASVCADQPPAAKAASDDQTEAARAGGGLDHAQGCRVLHGDHGRDWRGRAGESNRNHYCSGRIPCRAHSTAQFSCGRHTGGRR